MSTTIAAAIDGALARDLDLAKASLKGAVPTEMAMAEMSAIQARRRERAQP
jgi:hypothetical protein